MALFFVGSAGGSGAGAPEWKESGLEVPEPGREFPASWLTLRYHLESGTTSAPVVWSLSGS